MVQKWVRPKKNGVIVISDWKNAEWIIEQLISKNIISRETLGDILLSIVRNDKNDEISKMSINLLFKFHSEKGNCI